MGNLCHYFNQFQEYYCNFMDEQVAAVKASNGGKQRAQSDQQALKLVNDAISRSI